GELAAGAGRHHPAGRVERAGGGEVSERLEDTEAVSARGRTAAQLTRPRASGWCGPMTCLPDQRWLRHRHRPRAIRALGDAPTSTRQANNVVASGRTSAF